MGSGRVNSSCATNRVTLVKFPVIKIIQNKDGFWLGQNKLIHDHNVENKQQWEPQAMEYRIDWDIYTAYACTAGMCYI